MNEPNHKVTLPDLYHSPEEAEQVKKPSQRLPKEVVERLSKLRPGVTVLHVLIDWVSLAAAIVLCERHWSIPLYLVTCVFIAARQHAIGVLFHEGTHYTFHKHRTINAWLSDVFCAWPLGMTTEWYRNKRHFPHHRYIGMADDPHRWQSLITKETFPLSPGRLTWITIKDVILGLLIVPVVYLESIKYSQGWFHRLAQVALTAAAAALVVKYDLGTQVMLYWFIPLMTVLRVMVSIRLLGEHYGIPGQDRDANGNGTRTTLVSPFGKVFLYAHNINYHVEHHIYPGVPYYNLPEVHRLMQESVAAGKMAPYAVSRNYWQVILELVGRSKGTPAARESKVA